MATTTKIVDHYPEARQTVNAACMAIIEARDILQRAELTAAQRQELIGMLLERAREFEHQAETAGQSR